MLALKGSVLRRPMSEQFEFFLHDREREAEDVILLTFIHLRTLVDTGQVTQTGPPGELVWRG